MKDQPELITLDSGLRVLCDFMPERESVAVGVWVKTGSRYENRSLQGISHFLEHMVFKGTRKRSARQISQAIEGRGGTLNGFTTEEFTCYWARVRAVQLSRTLEVLFDLVLHPRLERKQFEKEKGVIKEEIRMYRDNPSSHVQHLLQETMWPRQGLGRSILGSEKTIDAMKREDMDRYRRLRYRIDRMAVIACGNVRMETLIRDVIDLSPATRKKKKTSFPPARYNRGDNPVRLEDRPTEQVHLSLGLEGLPRAHRRKYELSLLNVILGANMSSRLFQEIREKRGWVYSVRSALEFYEDTGAVLIGAGLLPSRLESSLGLICRQMNKLRRLPPSRRELQRAKEYYLGQFALSSEQTTTRMIRRGDNLLGADKVVAADEVVKKIQRITPENIRKIAGKIFRPGKLCLAVVGPLPPGLPVSKITELLHRDE